VKTLKTLVIIGIVAAASITVRMVNASDGSSAQSQAARQQLFLEGAELWPVYCAQCHNARPGSQFSPRQWDAIMMHMRTQANLPAKDARAVLEYLKSSR
jgi:mono/diheme cytochrome c family protein